MENEMGGAGKSSAWKFNEDGVDAVGSANKEAPEKMSG